MKGAGWSPTIRRILLVTLAVLALLTVYQVYRIRPAYQLRVFSTPSGWGYDVLNHDSVILHQPVIPGVAGNQSFVNDQQARQVGERAISKIRKGQGLPTITQDELRAMHITIP